MSWEHELFALFDDLEGQATAAWEADREAELADRARAEYGAVTLASRLMASRGQDVALDLPHVGRLDGRLARVGEEWCLLSGARQDWIVPLRAVTGVHGASGRSVPEVAWSPVDRLGLRAALRRLADAGARCLLHLADGSRHEAYVRRVGADFLEALDAAGSELLVPYAGLVAVQSRED
ncbi:hypothetical protein GCM10011376_14810 [Nocardioides flavus (ex Wang et al. 2016)]|uniref:Uncharacterized protein n=1 Tax=Nocardioides flavus (ex Wang et al. 2016) TaxID=2058780 RepID=A0ABQ3HH36_9ACTN|nr:hypothetical protein [Nocardioides flavus (ex Wang et al. 2016)]GHE16871.1 hypothetical protein GCM10011376_14810 [Nocardioides flavus (ex Wang et al. 2016)]